MANIEESLKMNLNEMDIFVTVQDFLVSYSKGLTFSFRRSDQCSFSATFTSLGSTSKELVSVRSENHIPLILRTMIVNIRLHLKGDICNEMLHDLQ